MLTVNKDTFYNKDVCLYNFFYLNIYKQVRRQVTSEEHLHSAQLRVGAYRKNRHHCL